MGIEQKKAAYWLNAGHFIITEEYFGLQEKVTYLRQQADRYQKWHPAGKLHLNRMKFTAVPACLLELKDLSELEMNGNPIGELPDLLFEFSSLKKITSSKNKALRASREHLQTLSIRRPRSGRF